MGANLVEEWKGQKEESYYYYDYDYQLIYIFHCYLLFLLFYYCLRVRVFSERR